MSFLKVTYGDFYHFFPKEKIDFINIQHTGNDKILTIGFLGNVIEFPIKKQETQKEDLVVLSQMENIVCSFLDSSDFSAFVDLNDMAFFAR